MVTVITYLPKKYSEDIRKKYIDTVEGLIEKTLNVPKENIALINHFVPLDEICYIGADTKTIYLYHSEEFSLEQKAEMTKAYDEKCVELFGDDKGMTIMIFKPHQKEEAALGGKLGE